MHSDNPFWNFLIIFFEEQWPIDWHSTFFSQIAWYSWGFDSGCMWTPTWWNNVHINCLLQVPCDAFQRMETADTGYDWERRTFLGDSLCAICWSCYSSLAICCSWICSGVHPLQYSFRCLWCSCGLSGTIEFPFLQYLWWQTVLFLVSFVG